MTLSKIIENDFSRMSDSSLSSLPCILSVPAGVYMSNLFRCSLTWSFFAVCFIIASWQRDFGTDLAYEDWGKEGIKYFSFFTLFVSNLPVPFRSDLHIPCMSVWLLLTQIQNPFLLFYLSLANLSSSWDFGLLMSPLNAQTIFLYTSFGACPFLSHMFFFFFFMFWFGLFYFGGGFSCFGFRWVFFVWFGFLVLFFWFVWGLVWVLDIFKVLLLTLTRLVFMLCLFLFWLSGWTDPLRMLFLKISQYSLAPLPSRADSQGSLPEQV